MLANADNNIENNFSVIYPKLTRFGSRTCFKDFVQKYSSGASLLTSIGDICVGNSLALTAMNHEHQRQIYRKSTGWKTAYPCHQAQLTVPNNRHSNAATFTGIPTQIMKAYCTCSMRTVPELWLLEQDHRLEKTYRRTSELPVKTRLVRKPTTVLPVVPKSVRADATAQIYEPSSPNIQYRRTNTCK